MSGVSQQPLYRHQQHQQHQQQLERLTVRTLPFATTNYQRQQQQQQQRRRQLQLRSSSSKLLLPQQQLQLYNSLTRQIEPIAVVVVTTTTPLESKSQLRYDSGTTTPPPPPPPPPQTTTTTMTGTNKSDAVAATTTTTQRWQQQQQYQHKEISLEERTTLSTNGTDTHHQQQQQQKGIAIYTCGPTVYGPAHLGHARTYIWMDVLRRCIEYQYQCCWNTGSSSSSNNMDDSSSSRRSIPPAPPLFVMNITDVDDKIIAVAKQRQQQQQQQQREGGGIENEGTTNHNNNDTTKTTTTTAATTIHNVARQYEMEFWNDLQLLNCLRPHIVTRVSEYVTSHIIPYIQQLMYQQQQCAYILLEELSPTTTTSKESSTSNSINSNDGIYFDIQAFEGYSSKATSNGRGTYNNNQTYGKLGPANIVTEMYQQQQQQESGTSNSMNGNDTHSTAATNDDDDVYKTIRRKKRDPRDFVLWRFKPPPPPPVPATASATTTTTTPTEDIGWNFPIHHTTATTTTTTATTNGDDTSYYYGRPGWHIECTAMIDAIATQFRATHTFTVHAGGIDLQFPHHTNEIAQAEAYYKNNNNDGNTQCRNNNNGNDDSSSSCSGHHEWIPHWVHTGHLHIDGLKMSKSLKNFITIQEFLQTTHSGDQQTTSLSSRADDLRIWCLGLSGSYRTTAVYSEERIEESRIVRNKIIRFLLDGEEWLLRHQDSNCVPQQAPTDQEPQHTTNTTRWRDKDCELYSMVNDAVLTSKCAIMNDLDGSTYVEQMIHIAEEGRLYLREETTYTGPTEPVRIALQSLRDLLTFVGFTDATCRAGLSLTMSSSSTESEMNNVNYRAIVNELAKFRSAVRRAAIDDHKKKNDPPTENMKKILVLCDEVRDNIFPPLGIEFLDGKGIESIDKDGKASVDNWRYCLPKKSTAASSIAAGGTNPFKPTKTVLSCITDNCIKTLILPNLNESITKNDCDENQPRSNENTTKAPLPPTQQKQHERSDRKPRTAQEDIERRDRTTKSKQVKYSPIRQAMRVANTNRNVPAELYFQTGPYVGLFSEYDPFGFPVRDVDGQPISNRQSKVLMKVFVRHMKDYNNRQLKRKKTKVKSKYYERRSHELLEQRKLPKVPPPPDVYLGHEAGGRNE